MTKTNIHEMPRPISNQLDTYYKEVLGQQKQRRPVGRPVTSPESWDMGVATTDEGFESFNQQSYSDEPIEQVLKFA